MSLRRLSVGAMIAALEYTLNHEDAGAVFAAHPILEGYRPRLQEVYDALISSRQERPALAPEKERVLRQELKALDDRHDGLCRLLHGVLTLAFQHADSEGYAYEMEELRDLLFPFGKRVVQMKLPIEAAEAKRLAKQIEVVSNQKLLQKVKFSSAEVTTNALKLAQEIVEVGTSMDEALARLQGIDEDTSSPKVREAKRSFMAWMRRFDDLAALELSEDSKEYTKLLKVLHEQLGGLPDLPKESKAALSPSAEDTPATNETTNT